MQLFVCPRQDLNERLALIAASTPARASLGSWPGYSPMRQESVHAAATVEGQSPPEITPGFRLMGCSNAS
jgi:hypothetical protein